MQTELSVLLSHRPHTRPPMALSPAYPAFLLKAEMGGLAGAGLWVLACRWCCLQLSSLLLSPPAPSSHFLGPSLWATRTQPWSHERMCFFSTLSYGGRSSYWGMGAMEGTLGRQGRGVPREPSMPSRPGGRKAEGRRRRR